MDREGWLAKARALGGTRLGMALGVSAYCLFGVHDASIKFLVEALPVWEVLFFRSLAVTVVCMAIGRTKLLARAKVTTVKGALIGRAALTLAAWICYFTASRQLPLAQMTALYFTAPIMVSLIAAPLLGERVTPMRWLSVGLGFVGVLMASDPRSMAASLPALLVVLAAAFWGYAVILMRRIARRESSLLQMLVVNAAFTVATGAACLVSWVPLAWSQIGLIAVVIVFGGLAQYMLFETARFAPAVVMATVEYTALLWAFLLGLVIWGDVPALPVIGGAVLILAAGAILVTTERPS